MSGKREPEQHPKSLADILVEELNGREGDECTQEAQLDEKKEQLKAAYERIQRECPERSALCLSGGGIRSATFGLGILQGLARRDLLEKFDYLSTVSGGGFVGGWLSAWIYHHPRGRAGVMEDLKTQPDSKLNPEHEPIRHLRAYSNYLAPKLGFFSADTWTLGALFLRNMLLNWLVLVSWIAAFLILPRLCVFALVPLQPRPVELNLLMGAGIALLSWAMAYAILDTPCSGNLGLSQARFVLFRQIPMFAAVVCLCAWWAGYTNTHADAARFQSSGVQWFVGMIVGVYLLGGFIGNAVIAIRRKKKIDGSEIGNSQIKEKGGKRSETALFAGIRRMLAVIGATFVGGVLLWLIPAKAFPAPSQNALLYVCLAPSLLLGVLLIVNFLFVGLASWVSDDEDREWWGRSAAWFLINMILWSGLTGISLFGPPISRHILAAVVPAHFDHNAVFNALIGGAGGLAGVVMAWLGFSPKTSAAATSTGGSKTQTLAALAALLFFIFLSLGISRVLDSEMDLKAKAGLLWVNAADKEWLSKLNKTQQQAMIQVDPRLRYRQQAEREVAFFLILLGAGAAMGLVIDVNKFSLHDLYRNRLIRAFLGASRPAAERHPHKFTGFDPDDNVKMAHLPEGKPFHVVNVTLNLVKDQNLAWQERKAESFTVSRLHCGSWHLGYRPAQHYGHGISLGTALAISGAAASPNMGYNSSPLVAFLMTLFNVRLGWWLGNPGSRGERKWYRRGPVYSVGPLFAEAAGQTTSTYGYVNLSDGGHFDNLGLYEMVARRCRFIVVVDAGRDLAMEREGKPTFSFEDLGNAIRKIRIDFGVSISFDGPLVSPRLEGPDGSRFALGTIDYPETDASGQRIQGRLLYIKPVLAGDEPADVRNYATAHPEFPHEPTTDQFFSESQLESYRALGLHMVDRICGDKLQAKSIKEFLAEVKPKIQPVAAACLESAST